MKYLWWCLWQRKESMQQINVMALGQQFDCFSPSRIIVTHENVMIWKHFPRYCPFVKGIHHLPVDSPHKGPVTRTFDVFFDVRIHKRWTNSGDADIWDATALMWRHCSGTCVKWTKTKQQQSTAKQNANHVYISRNKITYS